MTKTIDPVKLKAAAEHLESVLKQYVDSDDVQNLLRSLIPLIADAKAGRVLEPVEKQSIPGAYNLAEGLYEPYIDPNVGNAYAAFAIEMRGGLTEEEKELHARIDAYRKSRMESKS